MKFKLLISLLSFFLLLACRKDNDGSGGEPPPQQYAQLEVTVLKCVGVTCNTMEPVAGASVFLYEFEEYRNDGDPVAYEGTTGGTGKVSFNLLEAPEFWLTIVAPDGKSKKDWVRTPARTKSFLEVIFED